MLLIRIVVGSTCHHLALTMTMLQDRETEMQSVATLFDVPTERWNGSRIVKYMQQHTHQVTLDPVAYCQQHNLSHSLEWKPWLTDLLQEYYETGVLRVGDECQGDDLLLALEYFGILYQPSQLVFQSRTVYQKVYEWSEYLACRASLAEYVALQVMERQEDAYWITSPTATTPLPSTDSTRLETPTLSARLLYHFFNPDPAEPPERAQSMRHDFEAFLEHMLSHVQVQLQRERMPKGHMVAVLRTHIMTPSQRKLDFPLDELVQEDLDNDVLEKLVEQAGTERKKQWWTSPRLVSYEEKKFDEDDLLLHAQRDSVESLDNAPLRVIRASSHTMSVASALTGPFFLDDDGSLKDVYADEEEAQVLREEWVRGRSGLNGAATTGKRALLDDATDLDVAEIDVLPKRDDMENVKAEDANWDWFTMLCNYPISLLSNPPPPPVPVTPENVEGVVDWLEDFENGVDDTNEVEHGHAEVLSLRWEHKEDVLPVPMQAETPVRQQPEPLAPDALQEPLPLSETLPSRSNEAAANSPPVRIPPTLSARVKDRLLETEKIAAQVRGRTSHSSKVQFEAGQTPPEQKRPKKPFRPTVSPDSRATATTATASRSTLTARDKRERSPRTRQKGPSTNPSNSKTLGTLKGLFSRRKSSP